MAPHLAAYHPLVIAVFAMRLQLVGALWHIRGSLPFPGFELVRALRAQSCLTRMRSLPLRLEVPCRFTLHITNN